jgi:hypothetical protein
MLPIPRIKGKSLNEQLLKEQQEKKTEFENMTISKRITNKLYELWKLHGYLTTDPDIKKQFQHLENYIQTDNDRPTKSEITELYALNIHIIDCIGYILLRTDPLQEIMNIEKYPDKSITQIKEIEFKETITEIKNNPDLNVIEKIDNMVDKIDLTEIAKDPEIKTLISNIQKPKQRKNKKRV